LKQLVLLGGGHAHIHVLQDLARLALPACQVTLVSPFDDFVYSGMVPGFVAGHYRLDDCRIPLARLATAAKVRFVVDQATGLDAASRSVALAGGQTLRYDVLGIDTGPVMDRDSIPGAREHALFVRPMERFVQLWGSLLQLAQHRSLSIVVIGAGAGGVELAMALQYRLGERARVTLLTGGPPVLADHSPAVQQRGVEALKRLAITVLRDSCREIDAAHVRLASGARLVCDAPLLAIGTSAPAWLRDSGLALDAQGFVATTATLQSASHPEVFAAGDVATRADAPRPKSGVYAVRAGPPLALNLRRFVAGGQLEPYVPQPRSLNLLSCGARRAIASYGDWSAEGRWVWWWKDWIDRGFVKRFNRGV
jgi:pyridine nucleotide-disulfide oxidoreductase family protein